MAKQNEGRERSQRSRPISKTEFLDRQKLTQQPAHSQQLSETQSTCTRCAQPASALHLIVRLAHPAAPAEVQRLCGGCSASGGTYPHCAAQSCSACGQSIRMVWGWLLCWQPLQMIPLCLACVCRFQANAAAEREAEASRLVTRLEQGRRAAA